MILAGVGAGLEEGRKPRASGDDPRTLVATLYGTG